MLVRFGDGLVAFEVDKDSVLARAAFENTVRRNMETHFGFVSAAEREKMIAAEMAGYDAAPRALTTWCRCGDVAHETTSYYVRADHRHGWFHDPAKDGCGGLTQVG